MNSEAYFTVGEEDLNAGAKNGFEPGTYQFTIESIEDRTSAQGTPGLDLTLSAFRKDGSDFRVFDSIWLTEKAKWKYLAVAKSLGIDVPEGALTKEDVDKFKGEVQGKTGWTKLDRKDGEAYLTPQRYLAEMPVDEDDVRF